MTQPLENIISRHERRHRDNMDAQLHVARQLLSASFDAAAVDFSAAATACHRALQFQRQLQALTWLRRDLGL